MEENNPRERILSLASAVFFI